MNYFEISKGWAVAGFFGAVCEVVFPGLSPMWGFWTFMVLAGSIFFMWCGLKAQDFKDEQDLLFRKVFKDLIMADLTARPKKLDTK